MNNADPYSKIPPIRGPVDVRLWARVDKTGDCWLWTGSVNALGYGRIRDATGRNVGVHRLAYELEIGPIPDGLEIDHLCRNPSCVNPDHLEAVTHQENIRRGTSSLAEQAQQTHCIHGHPLSGANLYIKPNGRRVCRICRAQVSARHRARAKIASAQSAETGLT